MGQGMAHRIEFGGQARAVAHGLHLFFFFDENIACFSTVTLPLKA